MTPDPRPPRKTTRTPWAASWRMAVACVAVLVTTSCGDDPVAPFVAVATTLSVGVGSATFSSLGEAQLLTAVVRDQNGDAMPGAALTWTSLDPSVVGVSTAGLLTSVGNGATEVTASSGAAADTVDVTVTQITTSLALSPDSIVLHDPGDTLRVTVTAEDLLGMAVTLPAIVWGSSDSTIATVSGDGLVTAVATGSVVVSAQVDTEVGMLGVRVEPELAIVASSPTSVSAEVASDVALSVLVEDLLGAAYAGATVSWSVDTGGGQIVSSAVSTSDGTGHAAGVWRLGTGAGAQTASASITTRGNTLAVGFAASASAAPAASAFLIADSVLLSASGETAFLAPSFLDQYGNPATAVPVSWMSDDPTVAMVAPDGRVTGQLEGATYIHGSLGTPQDSILVTVVHRGAITVTFDDGWLTTYTDAWPLMQQHGFQGNVGVYTEPVDGGFGGYMTLAQLQELHDDGWSLVSHTVSHDSLTLLSDEVLDYELRISQKWLEDRGFGRASHIFIAPYHDYTLRERQAVSGYYQASRGTSANFVTPDSLVFWQPSNPYELTGIDVDQLPYTTVQGRTDLRAMLQRTVDEGRFLDVLFHQVPPANVAAFMEVLNILDDFSDRVLPYHELYPAFARAVF